MMLVNPMLYLRLYRMVYRILYRRVYRSYTAPSGGRKENYEPDISQAGDADSGPS